MQVNGRPPEGDYLATAETAERSEDDRHKQGRSPGLLDKLGGLVRIEDGHFLPLNPRGLHRVGRVAAD